MGPIKDRALRILGYEPETLDQLAEAVRTLIDHSLRGNSVVGFSWEVMYRDSISNTHDCPEGGVTNWGWSRDNKGLPTGYPGLFGRVWIRYKNPKQGFGSDPFSGTLSHTGTGGAGSYSGPWADIYSLIYQYRREKGLPKHQCECYSWDYRIFTDDWPVIKEHIEQEIMFKKLSGSKSDSIVHHYLWDDPVTKSADQEFRKLSQQIKV